MPAEDASALLRTLDGYLKPRPGTRPNPSFAHYSCGLSVSICPDTGGLVDAVELYRPERDVTVLFGDIPIFDLPADEVIRRIESLTPTEVQDEGLTVIAPALLLALGRSTLPEDPDDPDGMYFESVLVAAPGYYDGPLESAAPAQALTTASEHTPTDDRRLPLF